MILKTDYNALILVGLWNKGIFNPDWVSKFLLPKEKKLNVEFPLNFDGSPRVSSDKIRIYVIGNKLNFVPLNNYDETYEIIQNLAIKIADYLPHTPVSAFGINILFEKADPDDLLVQLVRQNDIERLIDFGILIKSSQHRHNMEVGGKLLNLSISSEDSKINFEFNFHFNINSLSEFKEQIHSYPISDLKKISLNIMKEVYNLELKK